LNRVKLVGDLLGVGPRAHGRRANQKFPASHLTQKAYFILLGFARRLPLLAQVEVY
jgi:hypothetical protein